LQAKKNCADLRQPARNASPPGIGHDHREADAGRLV